MSGYRDAVLALAPVAYWRFGEPVGTVAVDELYAHHGTYADGPTIGVTGLLAEDTNKAASFAAWPQRVIASDTGLPAGAAARTFGLLVNVASLAATRGLGGYGGGGGTTCAFRVTSAGAIELHNGAAVFDLSAAGAVTAGQTASIFIVYDGARWITYANGSPSGAPVAQVVNTVLGGGVLWGGDPFGTSLVGTLDEPVIYDRALTAAEVAALYATGAQVFGAGRMATAMDGIATAGATVAGVDNAYAWPVESITVPCVVVGYPRITFDMAYADAADTWVFPVWYVVGRTNDKGARDALSMYLEGTGSLKSALDGAHAWGDASMTAGEIAELLVSGVSYLAVKYDCEVYA